MNSAAQQPLVPQGADWTAQEVLYLQDYRQTVNDLAFLYALAWQALEEQLGSEAALALARDLLPGVVQAAQREALGRQAQRQSEFLAREAAASQAQQQQRPPMPENPW